ncbi:phage tail tape measure protein, partial [Streptococcus suis]
MRVAGLAAGYVGVREGLRGTVGAAIGFESAFADVRKVVDGSDDQLNNLRREILALSKEMPVTAEGFAQIYAAAGQSNIPIQEMSKFSKMVAEVSTAWEVPVAETGQALAEIK